MSRKATTAWWKNPHFGFKKGAHMKKGTSLKNQLPIFDPKAASKVHAPTSLCQSVLRVYVYVCCVCIHSTSSSGKALF